MKIVVAPDSFKGSLTAKEAAFSIVSGLKQSLPEAEYDLLPIADGGEGTVEALITATNGKLLTVSAHNPNGEVIQACFGMLGDDKTAVIEVAAASGIQYLDANSDSLQADSYGTGELVKAALDHGADKIIVGLGGSGTTDGGMGMARALGVRFLDQQGNELTAGSQDLLKLVRLDLTQLDPRLMHVPVILAADVTNPLTGKQGAAKVFGPQKGLTGEQIPLVDKALKNYANVIQEATGKEVASRPSAGAAGGLGAGFMAFANAEVRSGIQTILEASHFNEHVRDADFVITGEGKLDYQTQFGKAPIGVAKVAKKVNPSVKVIAIGASLGDGATDLYQTGLIDALFSSQTAVKPLKSAIQDAATDLTITSQGIGRLIKDLLN